MVAMSNQTPTPMVSNAARLSELRTLIAGGLRDGHVAPALLDEFEFLWDTTPNSEKENLSIEYRSIRETIQNIRNRQQQNAGCPTVQALPTVHREPGMGQAWGQR